MSRKMKYFISYFVITIIVRNYCFAEIFYEPKNKFESSVSTVASPQFTFESEAQILMDAQSGKVIYENNADEQMLPASVTKIMTLLLVMEQIDSGVVDYTDKITCSANAQSMGGSQIWFTQGEELTLDEALKAVCVVSANDVTVALAEFVGGSEENFVNMMNAKAKELGMENTHFANCHGIDEDGHYTTARDIALMSRELITKHPGILKYTGIWMDSLRGGSFELSSTNKLIRYYDGATGLKTGYTSNAMYNLSATATRGDTTYICVVLKAPSSEIRLKEVTTLLDYGFMTYESRKVCSNTEVLDEIDINKCLNKKLKTKIKDDVYYLVPKAQKSNFESSITYNDNLCADIVQGDEVGIIEVWDKDTNEKIGESKIIASEDIIKSNLKEYIEFIFKKFFIVG